MTLFGPEDETTAPAEPSFRVRLLVAYDGKPFRGFAAQRDGVRTVGGDLKTALAKVLGHPVEITCAGRTDAGVHAWGQVVTFDAAGTPADVDLCGLQRSLNKMLAPAVAVREATVAPPDFDARHSATWRSYRYSVLNRVVPDPFRAGQRAGASSPAPPHGLCLWEVGYGEESSGAVHERPMRL